MENSYNSLGADMIITIEYFFSDSLKWKMCGLADEQKRDVAFSSTYSKFLEFREDFERVIFIELGNAKLFFVARIFICRNLNYILKFFLINPKFSK